MGDWTAADEAHIAYGLSSWHPTAGTRAAGQVSRQRRNGRRVRYAGGRLEYRDDAPPTLEWPFPDPLGTRTVIGEFTMADVVTIPSHLAVPEVITYMTVEAARDLSAPDTPVPAAVDERGRSAQTFVVDVIAASGGAERRATAERPGHLRRHRAARGGGGPPHSRRADPDDRRCLGGRDLRRGRLPPLPARAQTPVTAARRPERIALTNLA